MIDLQHVATELTDRSAEEVLAWTYRTYGRVAIVASFQAESSVLIHMAAAVTRHPEVVTLDTGRLPDETHEMMERVQRRYPIRLHVHSPDPLDLAELVREHGPNGFRRSREARLRCCEVRKSVPLARALRGYDAWVTGLRREQSRTRRDTPVVGADAAHGGIAKVAPLAAWRHEDVWDYIARHELDYHALYQRGYRSIGCLPCTRPTAPHEDERAGRWWWEESTVKECGLHWSDTGLVRAGRSDG